MIHVRSLLALILSIGSFEPVTAQRPELKFDHFNTQSGLLKNFVTHIVQDQHGLMWFATENGLNRFDGYTFSVYQYNHEDKHSLLSSAISALYEDRQQNLWVGTSKGLHLYDRKHNNFIRFDGLAESIEAIYEDRQQNLWVSTNYGEVYRVDLVTRTFRRYGGSNGDRTLIGSYFSFLEDSKGTLWYANEREVQIVDRARGTLKKAGIDIEKVTCMYEDNKHVLWIGSYREGLTRFDPDTGMHYRYLRDPDNQNSLTDDAVFCIVEDHRGKLWIGTDHGGLNILDTDRKTFYNYQPDPFDEGSISSQSIYTFLRDRNNNIWIGTYNGGVNLAKPQQFRHYKTNGHKGTGLNHNSVLSFCEDLKGNVWISTDGGGLNYFDLKTRTFTYFVHDPKDPRSIANNFATSVIEDHEGFVWVGLWNGGVDRFNPVTKKFDHFRHAKNNRHSLICDYVWKVFEDREHNIWIGTYEGLDRLDRKTGKFVHYNKANSGLSLNSVKDIFQDSDGYIWIATNHGLNLLNRRQDRFETFLNSDDDSTSISDNVIHSIFEDSNRRLWICTSDGLDLFNRSTRNFRRFIEGGEIPNNSLSAILEDQRENLWISTQNGITVFNPKTTGIRYYNMNDGLQEGEFNSAALMTRKGEMLFGGNNGFNLFDPDSIASNDVAPPIILTDFKIFNRSISCAHPNSILTSDISEATSIRLPYNQSVVTFEFAALNYILPAKNQYAYMLEGFDDGWNYVGGKRSATYTNLDPGEYVFRVKGSNNDGVWNEKGTAVILTVTPPYWATWWFRVSLGLATLALGYALLMIRDATLRRQKQKLEDLVRKQTAEVMDQKNALEAQAEDMQSLAEAQQAQTQYLQTLNEELQKQKVEISAKSEEAEKARKEAEDANKAKSIFLATMSHEIRTPMNGVIGMAALLAETTLTAEQQEYANTIRSSGEALLTVINDILDFSKIESGNLELEYHSFDLRQLIEEVMDMFSLKAAQKGIEILYEIDPQIPDQIIADSHRLRQVLLNLISNALKFTQQGEIMVRIRPLRGKDNHQHIEFVIKDSGIGIDKDKLSRLFKAFSQVDSSTTRKYGGTGLGLVISDRLVRLMNGVISVESQPGVGTTFSFNIQCPAGRNSPGIETGEDNLLIQGKSIMIVDDNYSSREILRNYLSQWMIHTVVASSGSEALELLEVQPQTDLVITDMLMPGISGLELAIRIRKVRPMLPVILMSSPGDETSKRHPGLFESVLIKPVRKHLLKREIVRSLQPQLTCPLPEIQNQVSLLSEEFAAKYPMRILLAEDNPVNQKLAIRVLGKLGYHNVDVAASGLDVIEKFNEKFYDIILMDVQMPEMDGLEATRLIRLKQYHQPVIISMTANVMAEDREACRIAGMDDYISKPINLEDLVSILQKWAALIVKKTPSHYAKG